MKLFLHFLIFIILIILFIQVFHLGEATQEMNCFHRCMDCATAP